MTAKYRIVEDTDEYYRQHWLVQRKFLGLWFTLSKHWTLRNAERYFDFVTTGRDDWGQKVVREWPQ